MKDEEMAEEWVRTKHNVLKDCLSACVRAEHKNEIQAFLDGLKAGRPQWHKVADGDLPKKEDVCLIYTTKGYLLGHYEQGGADGKVDYCGEPYSDFTEYPSEEELVANEVLAWCEIPTFDKE